MLRKSIYIYTLMLKEYKTSALCQILLTPNGFLGKKFNLLLINMSIWSAPASY